MTQVEELKVIIGMLPIWATGIVFFAVLAQFSSTFLEQGRTMNKHLGAFAIPPASLASFDAVSVLIWVPVYDRVLVPVARRLTANARGISELQRLGAGLLLSVLVMVTAAVVETRRLASAHGEGRSSMSILWQVPQYFLVGASVVFACVGQTEFFYNEAPPSMRSLCSALALLTVALGSYVSSLVVTMVEWLTTRGGGPGWIPDDLNDGHLDRFFWLLAVMSALNLAVFVCWHFIEIAVAARFAKAGSGDASSRRGPRRRLWKSGAAQIGDEARPPAKGRAAGRRGEQATGRRGDM